MINNISHDYSVQLVLIGDSTVGKTSIFRQYINNTFQKDIIQSIGVDYNRKIIEINGKSIRLQLWDTAGQEKYRRMVSSFYKAANGVFIIYDITNKKTFESLEAHITQINECANPNIVKYLIGNKCDLNDNREVTTEQAKSLADKLDIGFMEVSAKLNLNIEEMFLTVAQLAIENIDKESRKPRITLTRDTAYIDDDASSNKCPG